MSENRKNPKAATKASPKSGAVVALAPPPPAIEDLDPIAFLIGQLREAETMRKAAIAAESYVAATQLLRLSVDLRAQIDAARAEQARRGAADNLSEPELRARLEEMARRLPPQHLALFAAEWCRQEGLSWPPELR